MIRRIRMVGNRREGDYLYNWMDRYYRRDKHTRNAGCERLLVLLCDLGIHSNHMSVWEQL